MDILFFHDEDIQTDGLKIPHPEIENRPFLKVLLNTIGFHYDGDAENKYTPLNSFILDPKLVGIVNVTPDSFSDGGRFFEKDCAFEQIQKMYMAGANIVELGAQSTRPGYEEISAREEIARLGPVLEQCGCFGNIGLDTYFDEVAVWGVRNFGVKWVNDVNGNLTSNTIKFLANNGVKLVLMMKGFDIPWVRSKISFLLHNGMPRENIIFDPGIGFGKSKIENIEIMRNISVFRDFGVEVLLGHSRKSFFSHFTNSLPIERDVYTIAVSNFAAENGVDYLRIHDVESHMEFFVSKAVFEL